MLAAGLLRSGAQLWRCAPLVTPATLRERLEAAQQCLAAESEPMAKKRRDDGREEAAVCESLLEKMAAHLAGCNVAELSSDMVRQWLHDVGLGHMAAVYGHVSGAHLARLCVWDVERRAFSFADACSLVLHVAAAKRGTQVNADQLLWWDVAAASAWLRAQGDEFEAVSTAGWNGACLCSLTAQRVILSCGVSEATAERLLELVSAHRAHEEDEWARSWTALVDMPNKFLATRY